MKVAAGSPSVSADARSEHQPERQSDTDQKKGSPHPGRSAVAQEVKNRHVESPCFVMIASRYAARPTLAARSATLWQAAQRSAEGCASSRGQGIGSPQSTQSP